MTKSKMINQIADLTELVDDLQQRLTDAQLNLQTCYSIIDFLSKEIERKNNTIQLLRGKL